MAPDRDPRPPTPPNDGGTGSSPLGAADARTGARAPTHRARLRHRLGASRKRSRGEQLLRNGHILAASAVVSAGLGSLFWMLATRHYDAATVGRYSAVLAAATFLSTLGSLNLGDALIRFVPTAGAGTRRLVVRWYAISAVCSALAAVLFLLLIPVVSPKLDFLRTPGLAASFIAATAGYSIFVLQDGALTGVRRTGWVLGENTVFAVAKAAFLAVCIALDLATGILVSWAAAMVVSIVLTNVVLFRWAVPAAPREAPARTPPRERRTRWAAADYVGNLFSFATSAVLPLMVLNRVGAQDNAYYSLAYVIASTLYVAAFSMGSSLVVEGARAPERLAEHAYRLLRHSGMLLAAAAGVIVIVAPWALRLFGPEYAAHGTTVLRLMALSAVPNVVVNVAIQVARVRQSLLWMILVRAAVAVLVIGLTAALLPPFGLVGVGVAWLATECALALPLLALLRAWLSPRHAQAGAAGGTSPSAVPTGMKHRSARLLARRAGDGPST
ncbi:lipopolysaccharide biosynthesis protein [Streptacidiphilus melanogenes]|uniref:lipopolysaccharide biosynthesis protein n=1 Tax=Streptacidiphilus melanogenes TaxID=411235 RepID=UPI000A00085A|nr:lipopolysaccharide biosynthesis protein [Streptacidiphilus melanogenes]